MFLLPARPLGLRLGLVPQRMASSLGTMGLGLLGRLGSLGMASLASLGLAERRIALPNLQPEANLLPPEKQ